MLYGQNLRTQVRFSPNRDVARQAARKPFRTACARRCGSLHETFCMSRRILPAPPSLRQLAVLGLVSMSFAAVAAEPNFPITQQQRDTAKRAAEAGVPLSELLPDAPTSTPSSAATRSGISRSCT
jgi:hypothetical protein